VKYAWIKSQEGTFPVKAMCRVLKVRRSGYYAWKRPKSGERQAQSQRLDEAIRRVCEAHQGRYGSPRVTQDLKDEGWRVGRPRVAKRMRALGLKARAARKYKATTQSKHNLPVAPNRLAQDFTASAPNRKWVSDITYLWTSEGWLYLAVVMDLYSRTVVGWSLSERMTRELVMQALTMAVWRRKPAAGLVVHSDRGSQYASHDYQHLLERHGFLCSMSRKGDCYDNAAMESFFHSLKVEQIQGNRYATREQAKASVFEYIETYYNRKRRHSTLNYLSPCDFEARMAA
jgi:transposase InsO family protein